MKNKRRVELRGVIVDASYDIDWLASYIDRGMFTPESRVRAQIAQAAAADEDLELYISSQGGSVVAANEILAAFHDFKGRKSITVGAFAASAAAFIVAQAGEGVEIRAHHNSILLWHGAWGVVIGGKEAAEDQAAMLERINAPIRAALEARGVPAETIAEGFAEGRQLTMTASEAKEYGIVAEIVDEPAPMLAKLEKAEEDELLAKGCTLDLAACAAWQSAGTVDGGQEPPPPAAVPGTPPETIEARAGRIEAELTQARAENKALQAAKDREIAAMRKKLDDQLALHAGEKQALLDEHTAYKAGAETAADAAAHTISTLRDELAAVREAHAQVTGAALLDGAEGAPTSWPDAVARHGLAEAMKRFPDLARAYKEQRAAARR